MTDLPLIRRAIEREIWAMAPDRLDELLVVIERRAGGLRFSPEQLAAIKGPDAERPNGLLALHPVGRSNRAGGTIAASQSVGVIPIRGTIAQHSARVDEVSSRGGTSCERIAASLRHALADPNVSAIVLDVDSPGGSVSGVQALAAEIFRARGRKPITAVSNSLMASAAFWIGSAADTVVAAPGSQTGSIGVFAVHTDQSKAEERLGLKRTLISAGRFKTEGHPQGALGDEAREAQQKLVDAYYGDFTRDVARFRGVPVERVRKGFGEGRLVKDRDAVLEGMADRVGTLERELQRLSARSGAPRLSAFAAPSISAAAMDLRRRRHRHRVGAR